MNASVIYMLFAEYTLHWSNDFVDFLYYRISMKRPTMPSFRKAKKTEDDAEVETTTTKVLRSGLLGKMGLKKKVAKEEPEEEAPIEEPAAEEPAKEETPAEEPAEETPAEETAEERAEEPAEETPEEPAEEPAKEAEEREQPDEPVSTGFLCGCGV